MKKEYCFTLELLGNPWNGKKTGSSTKYKSELEQKCLLLYVQELVCGAAQKCSLSVMSITNSTQS